jgi:DNA-binding NarL/FixJ family response regulator
MRVRPQSFKVTQRSPLPDAGPTPAELAYWETRVLRQRYTAAARPGSENELFARIEHDGHWVYFPLESEVPEKAAARACEVYRALADEGWLAVRQRYVRQIVWAIYWFTEPIAYTYATLFSVLDRKRNPAKATAGKAVPVALVEPEPEVRHGLEQCLNGTPGYACVQTAALAKDLLRQSVPLACPPRLVLFNQHSLDLAAAAFQQQLQDRWPGVIAVPFGVFGHSDELFMGVTGMDRGYFLRRRLPTRLLEPLEAYWQTQPPDPAQLRLRLQPYFQNLIAADSPNGSAGTSHAGALSHREIEILRQLGAGHTDKTIADLLGISVWTVHAHVKSLFDKLGVHTRAEAVMRYLQK